MRRQNVAANNTAAPKTLCARLLCVALVCISAQSFIGAAGNKVASPKEEPLAHPVFYRNVGNEESRIRAEVFPEEKKERKTMINKAKKEREEGIVFLGAVAFRDVGAGRLNSTKLTAAKTTKGCRSRYSAATNQQNKRVLGAKNKEIETSELGLSLQSVLRLNKSELINRKTKKKRSMNTFQRNSFPVNYPKKFQHLLQPSSVNVSTTVATNLFKSFEPAPTITRANYYNKHYKETILSTSTRISDVLCTKLDRLYDNTYDGASATPPTISDLSPFVHAVKHGNHCKIWQQAYSDGKSIESDSYCDGVVDCASYSDEMPGCSGESTQF